MEEKYEDVLINNLHAMINDRKFDLEKCEKELRNWDYSNVVREALRHYKFRLEGEVDRYNKELFELLKKQKGIS
ncbi:hypothetical protein [Fredinandcohnia sp. 179-A 10B2 NHS]|uniref:hypothetical protein n=1 Tax=Fredinandcohnia sp. 179-A 10B2 NHS TaxID=3235176 RepID=UPI00399FA380